MSSTQCRTWNVLAVLEKMCAPCAWKSEGQAMEGGNLTKSEHRYDLSDPQAGKDVCDKRITTVKSHMRRYINKGHDVKSAGDMKAAIDSYDDVKGGEAAVVKLQEHNHTMKKHTMSGIQVLNSLSFESEGLRVWKAYDVGPGRLFSSVKGFETPLGPTDLCVVLPFSIPRV